MWLRMPQEISQILKSPHLRILVLKNLHMANETIESAQRTLSVVISKGSDISKFFVRSTGEDFIGWFNKHCADKGTWKGKKLGNSDAVRLRFNQVWDQFPVMLGCFVPKQGDSDHADAAPTDVGPINRACITFSQKCTPCQNIYLYFLPLH